MPRIEKKIVRSNNVVFFFSLNNEMIKWMELKNKKKKSCEIEYFHLCSLVNINLKFTLYKISQISS